MNDFYADCDSVDECKEKHSHQECKYMQIFDTKINRVIHDDYAYDEWEIHGEYPVAKHLSKIYPKEFFN